MEITKKTCDSRTIVLKEIENGNTKFNKLVMIGGSGK
tara:strand:+ start:6454 stop:6564 length:111 start_codon:yes stop_codon:yes gene_type:complete